jgi:hypothetical protein
MGMQAGCCLPAVSMLIAVSRIRSVAIGAPVLHATPPARRPALHLLAVGHRRQAAGLMGGACVQQAPAAARTGGGVEAGVGDEGASVQDQASELPCVPQELEAFVGDLCASDGSQ